MRPRTLVLLVLLTLLGAVSARGARRAADVVNPTCPISGRAVDGAFVVEHGGKAIGVCCAKCQAAVAGWTSAEKDAYLARLAHAGRGASAPKAAAPLFAEPDLATTCPIAGGPLGDAPVAVTLQGRTIRVCCAKCKGAAEADPAGTLAKVDAATAAAQRALYPLTTCVVKPEASLVAEDGADVAKEVVVGNRLFRVCCPGCVAAVTADPAKYAALLDEAAMRAQAERYPLRHCVVNPAHELVPGAARHDFVVAGRLVRTCCTECEAKVRAEPARYVGAVDAARAGAAPAK